VFPCTEEGIRDAIAEGGGPHTFDCDGPTTVMTNGEIVIDNDVVLDGEGNLTVDGSEVVDVDEGYSIFSVPQGVAAGLRGFVATGSSGESGGNYTGIVNRGTLALTDCTVSGNSDIWIAGVSNLGTMTIDDCTISENTGAGIGNFGILTLKDSIVSGNVSTNGAGGGGIVAYGNMTMVVDSTVSGNSALDGGGINACEPLAGGCHPVTLINSTVSGNAASGAAGGIYGGEPLTLTNSTVSGNSAEYGAGIFAGGDVSLMSSTISDNTASTDGGGIIQASPGAETRVFNSTVSGNSASNEQGDGIWHTWDGAITLLNSTVSNNIHVPDGLELLEIAGTLVAGVCTQDGPLGPGPSSSGYNIESPGDTCGFETNKGDQINVSTEDLNLGPLQNNGGPTMTHALLTEPTVSVAIDVIAGVDCVDAEGQPLTTDQRGQPRPETGGAMCDVGAFEVQPSD
jgi:parallel beta-helix repeat protein